MVMAFLHVVPDCFRLPGKPHVKSLLWINGKLDDGFATIKLATGWQTWMVAFFVRK
jgi:hypothetical protein